MDSDIPPPAPALDAPIMPGAPPSETRYISGFWRRSAAISLDFLALLVVMAYPAYRWFRFFSINPGWTLLIGFALSFFYFVILNSRIGNGQTLGKKVLGLRVVNIRGETISVSRSALRFLILATPFFAGKVQFTCDGQVCALTKLMSWIFVAWELVIAYLLIFNRRTRQSLHDLAAGTYVIKTSSWPAQTPQPTLAGDAASTYPAPPAYVTSQRIWLGHGKIILVGLTAGLVFGVVIGPSILSKGAYSELVQIQEAVQRSGKAQAVGVKLTIANLRGNQTPRHLQVSFVPTKASADEASQAAEIAAIVLNASPKGPEVDVLDIVVLHTADFGFLHYSANRTFSHTPDQWKIIILATGTGKGGSAGLRPRGSDFVSTLSGAAQ